jgi:LmbE family N-acetylglucosaminyl deacetylase
VFDESRAGAASLLYQIRGLGTTGDVLHVGAHPDDEDSGLIAMLARGHGARVVCWSGTRGEGGQNRVGPYSGRELGVYRTWETLDARAVDGGESWFGPFYDYDYSKSGAEALEKWGQERLVREIVRAIRAAQPQVVISAWRGDESDGHGHHTAVGVAVREAFLAAGDPTRFRDLESVGLTAWQARKLYVGMRSDWQPGEKVELGVRRPELDGPGYLRLNTGAFDPIVNLTYEEQGAIALNQHLTQGTTGVPTPGDYYVYLRLDQVAPDSEITGAIGLYDGVDTRLTGLAGYPGGGSTVLHAALEEVQRIAATAAECLHVDEPWRTGPGLLELAQRLADLQVQLPELGVDAAAVTALTTYLARKQRAAEAAAARCLGLRLLASVDRATLTPGESVRLSARLLAYGPDQPEDPAFEPVVTLVGADVSQVHTADPQTAAFDIAVPADAELSCPYWLQLPRTDYSYTWPDDVAVGEPFDPSPISVNCSLQIEGRSLRLSAPALCQEAFAGGYRQLATSVLPPISVRPSVGRQFLRTRDVAQQLEMRVGVLGHRKSVFPIDGVLEVSVPPRWTAAPDRALVSLRKDGDADTVEVTVVVPPDAPAGSQAIAFGLRCGGRLYESSVTAVMQTAPGLSGQPDEGTCLRRQVIAEPVAVNVDLIDVAVHEAHSYGYVSGAGDEVPRILTGLGLSVHPLSDDELGMADLAGYDTIVIGPNAFLARDALRKSARRLLDYAFNGGTLLVQYQGYAHAHLKAAPFAFSYQQPHDRVTHEGSPVQILKPDHFLMRFPNRIGPEDFAGWVRDRGMYFFGEWDPSYEPLLACADPGEAPKLGGLLVARYGRGAYAYCGYTLFRQLAAGVPGAFRLFANLLALPEGRLRERMEHLRSVSVFAALDDVHLRELARIAVDRTLRDGEFLFREGDQGHELYLIERGALDVLQGTDLRHLRTCVAGEPIGELAAITSLRRTASLRARGDTEVLAISSDDFLALVRRQSDIAEGMVKLLARRLHAAMADPASNPSVYD